MSSPWLTIVFSRNPHSRMMDHAYTLSCLGGELLIAKQTSKVSSVSLQSSDALVTSSFLFLVVRPGAPSSFLLLVVRHLLLEAMHLLLVASCS